MLTQSENRPIEDFRPRLLEGMEQFSLPGGDTGLYRPDGTYFSIPQAQVSVLRAMDGSHPLSELAKKSAAPGRHISIHKLLSTIRGLAIGGWLDNDTRELEEYGLVPHETDPPLYKKIQTEVFVLTAGWTPLAQVVEKILSPIKRISISNPLLFALLIVSATMTTLSAWWVSTDPTLMGDLVGYRGPYSVALLAIYCGAFIALTLREIFRGWVLMGEKVGIYKAGVAVRFLLVTPHLDDRHIFRTGRSGQRKLHLAAITGATLSSGILLLISALDVPPPWAQWSFLASLGSGGVLYAILCPFFSSDMGRFIDLHVSNLEGRRHALSYMMRRILTRLKAKDAFEGELYYVFIASFAIIWIYVGFSMSSTVVKSVLIKVAHLPVQPVDLLEKICIWGALGAAGLFSGVWLMAFLMGTVMAFSSQFPKKSPNPDQVKTDAIRAKEALTRFPTFAHMKEQVLSELAHKSTLLSWGPGKDVFRQGDRGDAFYVIERGKAEVIVVEDSGLERTVAILGPSDGFGEMALLDQSRRTATVRALGELVVVVIGREIFMDALRQTETPIENITALLRANHAFLTSDVFGQMSPSALSRVIGMCTRSRRDKGEVIISEGDVGDAFYIIESGTVSVKQQGKDKPLATLSPGQYFGEMALLSDEPRSATVLAMEPCVLLRLDRDSFHQVMTHDFRVAVRVEQVAGERTRLARPA